MSKIEIANHCIKWAWKIKRNKVYNIVKKLPYTTVLDAGCYDYEQIKKYLTFHKGSFGVGMDVKLSFGHKQSNISGIMGDITYLPLRNCSFDLITSTEVIEHLYEAKDFLREAHRVLKQGGYLVISTPNYLRWTVYIGRLINRQKILIPDHVHEYNPFELKKILGEVGFSIIETDYGALNPYLPPFSKLYNIFIFKIYKMLNKLVSIRLLAPLFKWDFMITAKKISL